MTVVVKTYSTKTKWPRPRVKITHCCVSYNGEATASLFFAPDCSRLLQVAPEILFFYFTPEKLQDASPGSFPETAPGSAPETRLDAGLTQILHIESIWCNHQLFITGGRAPTLFVECSLCVYMCLTRLLLVGWYIKKKKLERVFRFR